MSNENVIRDGVRWCFWINPNQTPDPEQGYIPSVVIENEDGHRPLLGRGEGAVPWYWGDLATAERIAEERNAKRGLSQEDVLKIIAQSMGLGRCG